MRRGPVVDVLATIDAITIGAIGAVSLAGLARVGVGWPAVGILGMGALGGVFVVTCSWVTGAVISRGDVRDRGGLDR